MTSRNLYAQNPEPVKGICQMKINAFKVLLIEDKPGDAMLIQKMLSESTQEIYDLEHVDHLSAALERLSQGGVDVILLDLNLPDNDGIDSYIRLQAHAGEIPILALTELQDQDMVATLFEKGVQDYLTKGKTDTRMFLLSIRHAIMRAQTTQQLQSSERRFRSLLENMTDTVIIVDFDGIVKFMNPAGERLFRIPVDEFVGRQFGFPVMKEGAEDPVNSVEIELFAWRENPVIAEMRAVETNWEGKKAWLASLRDITRRKKMEKAMAKTGRDLKKTIRELEASNEKILENQASMIKDERLKILLEMAGTMAHELNQPLAVMMGNIELLEFLVEDPEEYKNCLKDITVAGKEIAAIVKKIQGLRKYETRPYVVGKTIIKLDQTIKILSVEDTDEDFQEIRAALSKNPDIILKRARSIDSARKMIAREAFDLVLLDYILPDGDAFALSSLLKEKELELPVIIITGQGNEIIASHFIREGAYDYIPKTRLSPSVLNLSIQNTLEKVRLKREIKHMTLRIQGMALQDKLTGLYNRRHFETMVEKEMASHRRYGHRLLVIMMDIDHFRQVNDTYGHEAGDMVLKEISIIIRDAFRENGMICRYGGEEFAVLMTHLDLEKGRCICERLIKKVVEHTFKYKRSDIYITISVGISEYMIDVDEEFEDTIKRSLSALHQAKRDGGNRVSLGKYEKESKHE